MIGELIDAVASWRSLLVVAAVWGFAPRLVLRLIVMAFHRDDPRRAEFLGELAAIPRWERPIWVAEILEVAISEGLWERFMWFLTGRVIHRWHLDSGVRRNKEHPDSFWIPSEDERNAVDVGDVVKLAFDMRDGWGERMWVEVVKVGRWRLVGRLSNRPAGIPRLDAGDKIRFRRDHIIDITWREEVGNG